MPRLRTTPCRLAALLALMLLLPPAAGAAECVRNRYGDTVCPPPESRCVVDRYGDWHCSGAGGDAMLDRVGTPVCGVGQCVTDINGEIQCSTAARGAAALDRYSKAVCTQGCAPAQPQACARLTR